MTLLAVDMHRGREGPPDPNETIRRTVRALRSAHKIDAADLAKQLGISRQSLYNRLNGDAPWLAAEVAALAHYFGCSIQDLFEGTVDVRRPFRAAGNRQVISARTPPDGTPAKPTHTHRTIVLPMLRVTQPCYPTVMTQAC